MKGSVGQRTLPATGVQADNLYRFFHAGGEETLALRGVSLDVGPGELVAVVGPSGSGESARAGLAVALANDPAVLLADEPTGEIDGDTEHEVLGLLREQAEHGTAVVVVTHSTAVADSADRTVRMADGRVIQ